MKSQTDLLTSEFFAPVLGVARQTALWVAFVSAGTAFAQNLVVNGDFELSPAGWASRMGGTDSSPAGWTDISPALNPHAWVLAYGTIGRAGEFVPFPLGSQQFNLWGPASAPGNGGVYSGTVESMESPTADQFYAGDADPYYQGGIQQTINDLTIGQTYELTFDWATGQYVGFHGATESSWIVSFGSESFQTDMLANASQDFQPWRSQTYTFTASAASQVLSFLAAGAPGGLPPISLLDNVKLTAVPEPSSAVLIMLGLGMSSSFFRRRSRS